MTYKVFFRDNEVANFEKFKEVIEYISDMMKVDSDLSIFDFSVYTKID